MTDAAAFIENFLEHRDPDYDPVKRREYYLRNRELKGRQTTAKKTSTAPSTKSPVKKYNGLTAEEISRGNAFMKEMSSFLKPFMKTAELQDRVKASTYLSEEKKEKELLRLLDLQLKLLDTPQGIKFLNRPKQDKSFEKYMDVWATQQEQKSAFKILKEANSRSSTDKKRMTP